MLPLEGTTVGLRAREQFVRIREQVEERITAWYAQLLVHRTGTQRPDLAKDLAQLTLASIDGILLAQTTDAAWDFHRFGDLLAAALNNLMAKL